jgi:hypothetical protein
LNRQEIDPPPPPVTDFGFTDERSEKCLSCTSGRCGFGVFTGLTAACAGVDGVATVSGAGAGGKRRLKLKKSTASMSRSESKSARLL